MNSPEISNLNNKRLVSVYVSVCLCVCVFLMDAQTIRPIVSKLDMDTDGYLPGKIGLFS